jgi:hypothetical protein
MKINRYLMRICAWLTWGLCFAAGLTVFVVSLGQNWWYPLFALIFPILGTLWTAALLYWYPKVQLRQDGVCVKWWLHRCFYPWSDICQAGVSCFYPRGYYINRIVLVRAGCSRRGFRDFMFHLRNYGKLVYLPAKPDIIKFVRSCYGPLDFDLTDGRIEQSTVIEE